MTTAAGDSIGLEDLMKICRNKAVAEFTELIRQVGPDDITAIEAISALAALRPALERVRKAKEPPTEARVLNLVDNAPSRKRNRSGGCP